MPDRRLLKHQSETITGPLADAFIRLDYVWNREFPGRTGRVRIDVENGAMGELLYSISVNVEDGQTQVGIVTKMSEVVDSEITSFEDELRRVMPQHLDVPDGDPRPADNIFVSAVVLGKVAGGPRPARSTQPAVHYAINASGKPSELTEEELERMVRNRLKKRVDIRRAGAGFNMRVRESTILREDAEGIRGIIIEEEDVIPQSVRTVYIALGSGELPEPLPGQ